MLSVVVFSLLGAACNGQNIVPISPPIAASSSISLVESNFFGISFELSFMNEYFGNDTSTIPEPILNYLSAIQANNLRLRVGGNSGDTSTYKPDREGGPIVELTNPDANSNNQPVDYGPEFWRVMREVGERIGGAQWLIGLPLDANGTDPAIAADARNILGDNLDSILLGNEPDLYAAHGDRPWLQNYTVQHYLDEFANASQLLTNTSAGDILSNTKISGPTICCSWDLDTLLEEGYLEEFSSILEYITLQHYPQNNCFGSHAYELPFYLQHSNVIDLANYQSAGIYRILNYTSTSGTSLRMLMSEFNSASCGGIPGISDTFAVGGLWTIDYVLQMAYEGYVAAYIHTRERGVTYNLLESPNSSESSDWTTYPGFYSLLVVGEILSGSNASHVIDLDISSNNVSEAAYAVFDAQNSTLTRVVLINYANDTVTFDFPSDFDTRSDSRPTFVKFLAAPSITEKFNISWGGQTYLGAGDGRMIDSGWASTLEWPSCDSDEGCSVHVTGPGLAVVFMEYDDFAPTLAMNPYRLMGIIGLCLLLIIP